MFLLNIWKNFLIVFRKHLHNGSIVVKKSLKYYGLFGLGLYLCGCIFIDRNSESETKNLLLNKMKELKKEKRRSKLIIFPEGTRRNTGEIHAFKKGAFHLAKQTQTPIVPLVISSYKPFFDHEKKIFKTGRVIIEALPKVSVENHMQENFDSLMFEVRSKMIKIFKKNSMEIEKIKFYQ